MRHNGAIKTPTLEDVHEALDAIDSQLRDRADVLTNAQCETGAEQLVRTAKAVAYLVVAEEMLRPVLEMLENAGPGGWYGHPELPRSHGRRVQ